ncbi:MAG: large conductance mechanosensitive channel protein MscL [Eubacteriales bacterium]|nr:large conductance mechanosensitive channel protein MscL [Eubacteriales bacterium]MDD3883089.1 large conductance mechanosensitive channel protein MscL [Eubacteriales bacterium]MDD4512614.1 large conductance mechanosensitive channel protein MscL [Eubacteriales bacterium]
MKKLLKEFKDFAMRGNVIDLAVGMMIGSAFGKIVSSVVNDLIMPLIGALIGGIDFQNLFVALDGKDYATLAAAKEAGASTFNYGTFIQTVVDFLIIAVCIFIFVKLINKLKKPVEAAPAAPEFICPKCMMPVDEHAVRCPHCTSEMTPEKKAA